MLEKQKTTTVDSSELESIKSTNRILIIVLLVASFFLGSLTNKVSTLEKNNTPSVQADSSNPNQEANTQPPVITNDTIKEWAKDLGLNAQSFNSCLDEEKYKSNVEEDTKAGREAGVSGTPTFFVNGISLVGAQPFSAFKDTIDKELAGTTDPQATRATVDVGRLPSFGDKNAKVTIVEF